MLWFGKVFLLGMVAVWVGSGGAKSGAIQLKCIASRLPDGIITLQVSPALTSNSYYTSWTMKDGTAIAHYPGLDYNQTLVKDLTNRSIDLHSCLDFVHFTSREWNQTSDMQTVSEALCEANCTALMMTQTPPPAISHPTNSTKPRSPDVICNKILDVCVQRWVFGIAVSGFVVAVVLLLGLGSMRLRKWWNNRKRGYSTHTVHHIPAEEGVRLKTDAETVC